LDKRFWIKDFGLGIIPFVLVEDIKPILKERNAYGKWFLQHIYLGTETQKFCNTTCLLGRVNFSDYNTNEHKK
jgi:hypothetical protein